MTMEYKMKGGVVLTDEDFERMSEQAAAGEYPGTPGKWVLRPQGRPRLSDEELVTITFKVPRSMRAEVDVRAGARGESRSEFMRSAVHAALATM